MLGGLTRFVLLISSPSWFREYFPNYFSLPSTSSLVRRIGVLIVLNKGCLPLMGFQFKIMLFMSKWMLRPLLSPSWLEIAIDFLKTYLLKLLGRRRSPFDSKSLTFRSEFMLCHNICVWFNNWWFALILTYCLKPKHTNCYETGGKYSAQSNLNYSIGITASLETSWDYAAQHILKET